MYYCVKTIWIVIDLCLQLELLLFYCVNLLYATYFGGSPFGEGAKTEITYKKPIYFLNNRGMYGPIFFG
jgi:hypothetical protein